MSFWSRLFRRRPARWSVDYLPGQRIVRLEASGALSMDDIRASTAAAVAEARRRNAARFLVDYRDARPDLGTSEIYDLPQMLLEIGVERSSRAAVVFSPRGRLREDFEFFETRARNSGLSERLFTDVEAATAWLVS